VLTSAVTVLREDTRIGPAGWVLAANIQRVRDSQRLKYAELARLLAAAGREIPVLGLRRIERGERRVDFDDLLALAYVLEVTPVDLMVSGVATEEPYPVTAEIERSSSDVREWIRGEQLIPLVTEQDPTSPSGRTVTVTRAAIRHMPKDRAQRHLQRLGGELA
jgi:transcriptional regulator with XRE-family HTH domain